MHPPRDVRPAPIPVADGAVSVAMTSFNGALYIRAQLDSIARQTMPPREIVVTDDGSTDATQSEVEAFARTAPFPVTFVRNPERLGFQDNFLKAASLCSGEYVAFCDQDDVWLPHKLERGYRAMVESGAILSTHGAIVTDSALRPLSTLRHGVTRDEILPRRSYQALPGRAYGFTLLFHRDLPGMISPALRPTVPGEPGRVLYHDVWIALLASAFGDTAHIAEPLALYRQHDANAMGAAGDPAVVQLLMSAKVPIETYRANAIYARECAHAFHEGARALSGEARDLALKAERFHARIERNLLLRIALYEARGLRSRFAILARLLRVRSYESRRQGGLGWKSFVKDSLYALRPRAIPAEPTRA